MSQNSQDTSDSKLLLNTISLPTLSPSPLSSSLQRTTSTSTSSNNNSSTNIPMPEKIKKITEGFKINTMTIRDASSGKTLWQSEEWSRAFEEELKIQLPASILEYRTISREMNFSSIQQIENFHLVQRVFLKGHQLEEWKFNFGFVIPNTTNTWQCAIDAAQPDKMIPAHILKFLPYILSICTLFNLFLSIACIYHRIL